MTVNCFAAFYGIPRETRCKRRQGWENVDGYLTESADSRFHCIWQCLRQPECLAIEYTDHDKACIYYKWDQLKLTKNTAAQGITFVREASVVAIKGTVRYEYSYNQAVAVCVSFGGELTTYGELFNAWQLGLSHCSCGWVSSKNSHYPWALPSGSGCVQGVQYCSEYTPTADVYCHV